MTFTQFITFLDDDYVDDYIKILFQIVKRYSYNDHDLIKFFDDNRTLENWLALPIAWEKSSTIHVKCNWRRIDIKEEEEDLKFK